MRDAAKQELRNVGSDLAKSLLTLGIREFIAWIKRRRAKKKAQRA